MVCSKNVGVNRGNLKIILSTLYSVECLVYVCEIQQRLTILDLHTT